MKNLGKRVKDKVTGFEGIIVAKVNYLFGCAQYGVAPKATDGKVNDTHYFDEGRIEIISLGIEPAAVQVVGHPGADISSDVPKQ